MSTPALYDLSPALRLMIVGLLVALGPLAWVWLHKRHVSGAQRLRMLTLVTLFLTFDLVIFGAFTRLTDSGLGCPDWPGCYGHASPVGAQVHIDAAQAAMPSGPVTHPKAWIEMVHRYLATGVGVMILTLTVTSWLARKRYKTEQWAALGSDSLGLPGKSQRADAGAQSGGLGRYALSPWWPTLTLVWVCLQGAFGALTVTMKLFPAIVTMHLLGGMVLLALLKVQAERYDQALGTQSPVQMSKTIRLLVWATFALLWLQIALGGWVSTNYAVLACTEFPGCQNSLWPAMDFRQGFTVWRELGAGRDGDNISFSALTAIHYVHRLSAYVVFSAMLVLALKLYRMRAMRTHAQWLAGLAVLQMATGLGNVLLGWPLAAAVLHTGGAAALVIVLTGIVFCSRNAVGSPIDSKLTASKLSA